MDSAFWKTKEQPDPNQEVAFARHLLHKFKKEKDLVQAYLSENKKGLLFNRLLNASNMFQNYLKTAFRNFFRRKV